VAAPLRVSSPSVKQTFSTLRIFISDGHQSTIRMNIPRLDAQFTGSGDLFAALLLAWLHKHPDNFKLACEKVVSTMQRVLRRTLEHSKEVVLHPDTPPAAAMELRLIQSIIDIQNPTLCVEVHPLVL
jgi:pyridoxine kinase